MEKNRYWKKIKILEKNREKVEKKCIVEKIDSLKKKYKDSRKKLLSEKKIDSGKNT